MPFYGRPSKNCESCRIRRIKCDRVEPVCSQCSRAGKPCGGYRDFSSLLFRDENDKTVGRTAVAKSKAEARRKLLDESAAASHEKSRKKPITCQSTLVVRRKPHVFFLPLIPAVMPASLEDQGLRFFFNRFGTSVLRKPTKSSTCLQMADLEKSPLMATIPNELPLRDAVMAVGLAAMANVTCDQSLLLVAREKYVAGLNVVRAAVENPHGADPILTFKIILMLSLFEMVSCQTSDIDAWVVHLDGMAALLKHSSFSEALNIDARPQTQYLFLCIIRYFLVQEELPSNFLNWSPDKIKAVTPAEQPSVELVDILIRLVKLHHTLRHDPEMDPVYSAQLAMAFDTELDEWERNLPDQWAFTLAESNDHQHSFNGKYLVYKEVWPSRVLNHYFWGRLIVNEIILQYLAKQTSPSLRNLQQRQRALDTISRMATNICAGAASQMGVFGNGAPDSGAQRLPPMNGVFMLMFTLTMAGSAAGSPDDVHEWAIETLQKIGMNMGIQRALQIIPKIKDARQKKASKFLQVGQQFEIFG